MMVPTTVGWPEFLAGDISGNAVVMIANPPVLDDTAVAKLRHYLANGGAIVLFPGENDGIQAPALRQFPGWENLTVTSRDNPELTRMDEGELMEFQAVGHHDRQMDFARYLQGQGKDASDVNTAWPMQG